MDSRRFFGDSITGTVIRLVLLSVVVGIVLSALDITPANLLDRLRQLIGRITELGFDAFRSAFQYFLIGAVIVVPIWLVMRLVNANKRDPKP